MEHYQNTIPLSDEQVFSLTAEGRKAEREAAKARILEKRSEHEECGDPLVGPDWETV